MPEISFPPWHTLPQVISSGWEQSRYCNWWPLFQRYQFDPQYPKKGTHDTADSCTMGPLFVKGLFKTIAFSRRTGRKIKPSNRRPIKTIKVSKRTIKLSRSNTWGPVWGGSKLNKSSNEGGPAQGRQQKSKQGYLVKKRGGLLGVYTGREVKQWTHSGTCLPVGEANGQWAVPRLLRRWPNVLTHRIISRHCGHCRTMHQHLMPQEVSAPKG